MSPQVDESIVIGRAVSEVYDFYRDMRNLPAFLGDVLVVEPRSATTARWTVALPVGLRMHWTTVVEEEEAPHHLVFRTRSRTARWEMRFTEYGAATKVEERMTYLGGRAALVILASIGKHPRAEVRSDLHRLKQVLEDGHATDSTNTMGKRFE